MPNHNDKIEKTMNTYRILIISLLFSLIMASANAATYKWFDDNGNVVYSQQPPEGKPYETVKTKKPSSVSLQPTQTESSFMSEREKQADEAQVDNKIQQDVANAEKLRAQNCEAARNNLDVYTVYRRVPNEKGESVRLDDNVRAAGIEAAKQGIKDFCD